METTISKNTMFCSSCGNEISKSARFCTHCGAASGSHTAGNSNVNESSSGQTVQSKIYDISLQFCKLEKKVTGEDLLGCLLH